MAGEPYNEIVYKAAEKIIANGGGTAASPTVVVGNVASGAADSGAPLKAGGVYNGTLPTVTTGQRVDLQTDERGNFRALGCLNSVAISDGFSNLNGGTFQSRASGTASSVFPIVAPMVFNGTSWDRVKKPNVVSRIPSSANSTNATSAKASAGDLVTVTGYNSSATVTYLKFYNKASAPTVGTDTPFVTVALAPTATFSISFDSLYFSTGIAYGLTTDAADAGTTAVAAGAILGLNVVYS